jgi:hypothetical protein
MWAGRCGGWVTLCPVCPHQPLPTDALGFPDSIEEPNAHMFLAMQNSADGRCNPG